MITNKQTILKPTTTNKSKITTTKKWNKSIDVVWRSLQLFIRFDLYHSHFTRMEQISLKYKRPESLNWQVSVFFSLEKTKVFFCLTYLAVADILRKFNVILYKLAWWSVRNMNEYHNFGEFTKKYHRNWMTKCLTQWASNNRAWLDK